MKKWFITAAAAGLLAIAAVGFIGINSTSVSAAEGDTAAEDTQPDQWHDGLLKRLVDEGVISQQMADDIDETLTDGSLPFRGQGFRSLPEDFDPTAMLERMVDLLGNLDPEDVPEGLDLPEDIDIDELLEGFTQQLEDFDPDDLPEGFTLPEGFDPKGLFREFQQRFRDFDPQNPPEGFTPESFDERRFPGGLGFGLLGDSLKDAFDGLTPAEIRDALENGTLADLIDTGAILEGATADLDQAVAEGQLTEEQADHLLAGLTEKLQSIEDGTFRFGPKGPGGHRGFGHFGDTDRTSQAEDARIDA